MSEGNTVADSISTVFICVTCKATDDKGLHSGQALYDAVDARVRARGETTITVVPVECLAVCARACTVALAGTGKWTCIVGDLDPETNADDVIAAALAYQASESGIIPWKQRPVSFRQGLVSRTPPPDFRLAALTP